MCHRRCKSTKQVNMQQSSSAAEYVGLTDISSRELPRKHKGINRKVQTAKARWARGLQAVQRPVGARGDLGGPKTPRGPEHPPDPEALESPGRTRSRPRAAMAIIIGPPWDHQGTTSGPPGEHQGTRGTGEQRNRGTEEQRNRGPGSRPRSGP